MASSSQQGNNNVSMTKGVKPNNNLNPLISSSKESANVQKGVTNLNNSMSSTQSQSHQIHSSQSGPSIFKVSSEPAGTMTGNNSSGATTQIQSSNSSSSSTQNSQKNQSQNIIVGGSGIIPFEELSISFKNINRKVFFFGKKRRKLWLLYLQK